MRESEEKARYLDGVCAQVRWKQAHRIIRMELADHIGDQADAYAAEGMPEQEALHRAIREMGDPEEVGLAYNACFRPKQQWGMTGLMALAVLTGIAFQVATGGIFQWRCLVALAFGCGSTALFCGLNLYDLARRAWLARMLFTGFLLVAALELGGTFVRHAAAFLPLLFAGAVYSLRGKGIPALLACVAALVAATWVLMARWSMQTFLYAAGILAGCLFAAVLAALSGAFGRRRFLAAGFCVVCVVLAAGAVVVMHAYRMQEFMKLFHPGEGPAVVALAPGFSTVQDVVDGARLIGRGMVNSIANIQELTVVGRGNDFSANSYLLAAILHRYGWLAALAAAAVPLSFIGAAFWRVFRLSNLLGRMLAGAVCMFFTTQALVYCAVNFGLLGGLPLSLPLLAGGELALAANLALAGGLIALFRADGLYADRMPKRAKRLRIRMEWA